MNLLSPYSALNRFFDPTMRRDVTSQVPCLPITSSEPVAGGALQQRVERLSAATTQMASDLIGQFAQQLFGDQAQGVKIEFNTMSLSAESSFSAMQQSTQSAEQSRQVNAFRLSDASHFNGKGTLTTADGQRFDIEVDIRYEAIVEGMGIAQQFKNNNSQKEIPSGHVVSNPIESPASSTSTSMFNTYFPGTAFDLMQGLSSEPVVQPFSILTSDGQSELQLLGDCVLQLLNLSGGSRYLDLNNAFEKRKLTLDDRV